MKLKGYADYEKCRLPWLGRYPRHWSLTKTKRVCSFTTGWTPPTGDSAAYEGDCPWANISDLGQRVIFDTAKSISAKAAEDHGLELIPAGSLMFSFKLSVGQVAFTGKPMFSNEAIASFRESADLDLGFAYYAFPIFLIENAAENIYGAKLLNQFLIREAIFPLPPKPEQRFIATFLDRETAKIDALIAEQERLLLLLAEKRQAVISHAVTKGLNPIAPMKDSGVQWLGKVPAHWDILPLKCVSRIGNGSTPNRDNPAYWAEAGIPWLNSSVVNQDEVASSDQFVTPVALRECHLPIVAPPAILVGITGQGRTRGMASPLRFEATISQHIAYVKPVAPTLDVEYLQRFLECSYLRLREESDAAGSTKSAITCEQLSRMKMPLPPANEQREIAIKIRAEMSSIDSLSDSTIRTRSILLERRAALISAAVTGQVDVRQAT